MARLKAICAVAHPDDCVIFARPFIKKYADFDWHIVYLTYHNTDDRAREVAAFWDKQGISTEFLGFVDHYTDNETGKFNFWKSVDAQAQIVRAVDAADIILTHNIDGDYGHIHHILVARSVASTGKPMVNFAGQHQVDKSNCITIDEPLDLDQLPLHKDVIVQFQNINTGCYQIPEESWEILNQA